MRALSRSLLAFGVLAAISACNGKGDPVQDLCELALSCDCATPPFADLDACVTELGDEVERIKATAVANDLIYDASCVDSISAEYTDRIECGVTATSDACTICSPVHGTQPAGAACAQYGDYHDCAQNLFCINSVCLDPCNRIAADGVCAVMQDGGPQGTGNCADGLYCEYSASLTCKPRVAAGQPCPKDAGCADGLSCNGVTCEPIPGMGEACVFECQPGLLCDASVCKPLPGAGEPCPSGACEATSECDSTSKFCVARQPLVCGIDPK